MLIVGTILQSLKRYSQYFSAGMACPGQIVKVKGKEHLLMASSNLALDGQATSPCCPPWFHHGLTRHGKAVAGVSVEYPIVSLMFEANLINNDSRDEHRYSSNWSKRLRYRDFGSWGLCSLVELRSWG